MLFFGGDRPIPVDVGKQDSRRVDSDRILMGFYRRMPRGIRRIVGVYCDKKCAENTAKNLSVEYGIRADQAEGLYFDLVGCGDNQSSISLNSSIDG